MATGVDKPLPNVIVFGETGVGKSSVVNMLDGDNNQPSAEVGDGVLGVTFDNKSYTKTIGDLSFNIFDTAGLNEAPGGTVDPGKAIEKLRELIHNLSDGVNLLVYVMRAPRIKVSASQNYTLFFDAICRKKVPIVIVVTGLEEKVNMDEWWINNKKTFDDYKMKFDGHVCITSTKGKALRNGNYCYAGEYKASKQRLEKLIRDSYNPIPWKMSSQTWLTAVLRRMIDLRSNINFNPDAIARVLHLPVAPQNLPITTPNVIVFGENGAGKSSVINMLEGGPRASVSDRANTATFSSTPYNRTIGESVFQVFDTAGLDEDSDVLGARNAIAQLYHLIHRLTDGINLLVYVMRAPRITVTTEQNYKLFFETFCEKKVPIVIVVTGLEDRTDMDQWWIENEDTFNKYGMSFSKHACISATKGKQQADGVCSYATEYEDSKFKVEELIRDTCMGVSWKTPPTPWFDAVLITLHNLFAPIFRLQPKITAEDLYQALRCYGGCPDEKVARAMAWKIEKDLLQRFD